MTLDQLIGDESILLHWTRGDVAVTLARYTFGQVRLQVWCRYSYGFDCVGPEL